MLSLEKIYHRISIDYRIVYTFYMEYVPVYINIENYSQILQDLQLSLLFLRLIASISSSSSEAVNNDKIMFWTNKNFLNEYINAGHLCWLSVMSYRFR